MITSRRPIVGLLLALALCAGGCEDGSPGSSADGRAPAHDRVHAQAQAALSRWAAAAAAAGAPGIGIVGELTGQVDDWEEAVGDNNKRALYAGLVRAAVALPAAPKVPGEVRWSDGTTLNVTVLSAAEALEALARTAETTCEDCLPLAVTAATLVDGPITTTRGPATGPLWEFAIRGSQVRITRVAISAAVSVQPPPWNANDPPVGLSIEEAHGRPDATRLEVTFIGAPRGANEPCGADYSAEAVESDLALVVIVVEHRNPMPAACTSEGAVRTATVALARPLGQRAVLEVQEGRPVKVFAD